MTESFHRIRQDESGMALVSIMLILGALTILSVGLILFSSTEVQIADNYKDHTGALYVAEAGISEVLARMNLEPGTMVNVNGAEFDAYIGDNLENIDPNWRTEVYVQSAADVPSPSGDEIVVATIQPSASWLAYGDGDQLDPIVIEHKWVDLDNDGVREVGEIVLYDEKSVPAENFSRGNPVEVVTASGVFNGSRRTIRVELAKAKLSIKVAAPLNSDFDIDLGSTLLSVCGHVHDEAMPPSTEIPDCYAWELCENRTKDAETGCAVAILTTGDTIWIDKRVTHTDGEPIPGAKYLQVTHGYPAWSDTASSNVILSIEDALGITASEWASIKATADYTEDLYDGETLAGFWVSEGGKTVELKNSTGTGFVYTDGTFKMLKSTWVGFIYSDGPMDIGNESQVLGGIVSRSLIPNGPGQKLSKFKTKANIAFSPDAIIDAVTTLTDFKVLSWREI